MSGLLDWLNDSGVFGGSGSAGTPMQPGADPTMAQTDPMGNPTGGSSPLPTPAPAPTQPMPPVQQTGSDGASLTPPQPNPGAMAPPVNPSATDIGGGMQGAGPAPPMPQGTDPMTAGGPTPNGPGLPFPPGSDPMTAGGPTPNGPGLSPPAPVPMPQPRPPGAPASLAPPAAPAPAAPSGAPDNVPPSGQTGQSLIARALGITDKQAQQSGAALAQGLKAVPANSRGPGLAAFAGTAGSALEGGQKKAEQQDKSAADYLKAAIDAKKAGDDAGYKQNYLRYLAAKLKADTDKAANKDSSAANKNDSPTQLYLSAQRLTQPDRNALNKQIQKMRADGEDPAVIAKTQADGEAAINAKLNDHYSALGLHPQTAAQIAQQPGNSQGNPVDGKKMGLTADNIGSKLQPGQYFTNPADGKVYQYKGAPKKEDTSKAAPDKPTEPEPITPGKNEPGAISSKKTVAAADDDDDD